MARKSLVEEDEKATGALLPLHWSWGWGSTLSALVIVRPTLVEIENGRSRCHLERHERTTRALIAQ